jgi:protein-disulfide isomerase
MKQETKNQFSVPMAIVVAGFLIAGAIVYTSDKSSSGTGVGQPSDLPVIAGSGSVEKVKAVTKEDHIRGNPEAPVKIVEFSDTECPFCKRIHPTLQQIVQEYDGRVAWVYRHFPLTAIHPKAAKEAEATECAAELGGNDKFWAYLDKIFAVTPSNNNLDPAQLPQIAKEIGLDPSLFEACLASGRYAQKVNANLQDATNAGGQGTPYSIVIASNGKKFVISGAQPYESVKAVIETALAER